ncbi:MAG: porin [Burkholderiales bacterium RIFCSPLOWO2_02_FULL_57_36]|nr:MAG: porin [Burkholderiales bacterium RIFCSPLOWO2_02_FULL_57_36]
MRRPVFPKPLALAAALLCAVISGANAAAPPQADLIKLLEKLNQRMERLEQRNAELEREVRAGRTQQRQARTTPGGDVETRVQALEKQQEHIARSLESDAISDKEPEIATRLKAVETQAQSVLAAARKIDALDGIQAGLSLSTVAQRSSGTGSQLNYRGDTYVSLPLAAVGDIQHKVFAQFRLGQGGRLNNLSTYSMPNATAFQLGSLPADDSVAVLAQAWYQADIPLPFAGFAPRSKQRLELNFGKMDPFVFFDQNAAAGDETRQFLNSVFVHNPLLDAGGDIGVDANGFAPGLRLSYYNFANKPQAWRVSLGIFGTGAQGSNYQRSLAQPLVMLQAETEQRFLGGLAGNYRAYAWRNPQASHFDSNVTAPEQHSGWGISADQRIGDGVTLFGRYGQQMQGNVRFDRALTVGAEVNGSYWSRGGDSMGVAAGLLKSSRDYRSFANANSSEQVGELYYRYRISKQFELSPSFQYIGNPGGDGTVDAIKILGLRAQLTY